MSESLDDSRRTQDQTGFPERVVAAMPVVEPESSSSAPTTSWTGPSAPEIDPVFRRLSLKYLLQVVFRRKWVVIRLSFLVSILATVGSFAIDKSYVSSTTILVDKDEILNPLVRWQTAVSLAMEDRLATFEKIIFSRTLMERVARSLSFFPSDLDEMQLENAVIMLDDAVETDQSGSDSFAITVTWHDPVQAQKIAERVTEVFVEMSLEGDRKEALVAVEFMNKEMSFYSGRLDKSELALRRFKEDNPEKLPSRQLNYIGELETYRKKLIDTDISIKELSFQKGMLETSLAGESPMILQATTFTRETTYTAELKSLNIELLDMLRDKKPDHPDVVKLITHVKAIEALIVEDEKDTTGVQERREARSPTYTRLVDELQNNIADLEAAKLQREEYQKRFDTLTEIVAGIPEQEMQLSTLVRDLDLNKELYYTLRNKMEQARINQEVELQTQMNRFQILDPPRVPFEHDKPDRQMIIIAGVIGGIFLGMCMAFVFEFLDPAIQREEELMEVFNDKVLAKIPKLHV